MPDVKLSNSRVKELHLGTSIEDLQQIADRAVQDAKKESIQAKVQRLAKSLKKIEKGMNDARLENDEEMYYILAYRYVKSYFEVQKSSQFLEKKWSEGLISVEIIIDCLEELQGRLQNRYALKQESSRPKSTSDLEKLSNIKPDIDLGRQLSSSTRSGLAESKSFTSGEKQSEELFISDKDLLSLLKRNSRSLLLMDLRDSREFNLSHIVGENVINIPVKQLGRPVISMSIEKCLNSADLIKWRNLDSFDSVVIVNELGRHATSLTDVEQFIALITIYSTKPCKNPPLILAGGFSDFLLRYPQKVTDSHVGQREFAEPDWKINSQRMQGIHFPSISIFSNEPRSSQPTPRETFSPSPRQNGVSFEEFLEHAESTPDVKQQVEDNYRIYATETKPRENLKVQPNVNRALKPVQILPRSSSAAPEIEINLSPNVTLTRGSGIADSSRSSSDQDISVTVSTLPKSPVFDLSQPTAPSEIREPRKSRPNSSVSSDSSARELKPEGFIPRTSSVSDGSANIVPPASTKPLPVPPKPSPILPAVKINRPEQGDDVSVSRDNAEKRQAPSLGKSHSIPNGTLRVNGKEIDVENQPGSSGNNVNGVNGVLVAQKKLQPPVPSVNRVSKPIPVAFSLPEPPPPHEWEPAQNGPVEPGLTGLINLGNTCYMNAMLQCLAYSVPIRNYYLDQSYRKDVNPKSPRGSKGLVSVYMETLMKLIWCGKYRHISPKFMKKVLAYLHDMFRNYDQQDAHSALVIFVEFLLEDTNMARLAAASDEERALATRIQDSEALTPSALARETAERHRLITVSAMDRYLAFMTESVITCSVCRYESCTFHMDQMMNLWLGPHNGNASIDLKNLLDTAMQPSGQDAIIQDWRCPRCKQDRRASQRHFFHSTPQLLIILLKRFRDCYAKDTRLVDFAEEISVESHCRSSVQGQTNYRLYAVLDHYGQLDTGHYTATVLHPELRRWVKLDDQTVTVGVNNRNLVSAQAYILFYERV